MLQYAVILDFDSIAILFLLYSSLGLSSRLMLTMNVHTCLGLVSDRLSVASILGPSALSAPPRPAVAALLLPLQAKATTAATATPSLH